MEYVNKKDFDIKVPVKQEGLKPIRWITVKKGEKADIPVNAQNAAFALGLSPVMEEVKEVAEKVEKPVKKKALKSKVSNIEVETKKLEE